ncbi:MAG: helix-turn-helix domain-containing protein [Sphingomonas oligoaromativorans]
MIAAGDYLRLRREAAGLSVEDVVMLIVPDESRWPLCAMYTVAIELGYATPSASEVQGLREAFRFDPYVLRQLIAGTTPAPAICRRCGCSDLDPCDDETHGPCAWATDDRDLCSSCAREALVSSEGGLHGGMRADRSDLGPCSGRCDAGRASGGQ